MLEGILYASLYVCSSSGLRREIISGGGFQGYGRPFWGSGGGDPPDAGFFLKFGNNFKFQQLHYFSLIFKKVKNPAINYRGFGRKSQ